MGRSKYLSNGLSLILIIILLICSFWAANKIEKPFAYVSKQQSSLNLDNNFLSYFHLGQKRLLSSIFWISTILESDQDHYKAKDLNSWMFLRFHTISNLEPNFYLNYSFGGVYLSIIKDDIPGASLIFNKGLSVYPGNYKLLRDASYHFFYEARDTFRAYQLTQTIKKEFPEKYTLMGMMTKLEAEYGSLEESLKMLDEYQKIHIKGTFIGDKIYANRYALKAEIDLSCLNKKKSLNCSQVDLNNEPYIKSNNEYIAQTKWKPYRKKE